MNLKVTVSIPGAATSKAALWAKTAARAVLKTYPGATLTTEVIGSGHTTVAAYLMASAAGSLVAGVRA